MHAGLPDRYLLRKLKYRVPSQKIPCAWLEESTVFHASITDLRKEEIFYTSKFHHLAWYTDARRTCRRGRPQGRSAEGGSGRGHHTPCLARRQSIFFRIHYNTELQMFTYISAHIRPDVALLLGK